MVKPRRVEKEVKLIAPDAAALRGLGPALRRICDEVRHEGLTTLRDAYLDTKDARLYRAGFACRIRRTRDEALLVLKGLTRPRGMVSRRDEYEQRVPLPLARKVEKNLRGALGRKVLALADDAPLEVIFRVRNRRRNYAVRCGDLRAIVSADDFTLIARGRSRTLAEVEIEATAGDEPALRRLARALSQALRLKTGSRAKFREGRRMAGETDEK